MGSGPPLTGGSLHPHPHGSRGSRGIDPQGGHGAARHRVVGGGASGHRGGTSGRSGGSPPALKEQQAGLL
jgi:hypothetical protein